jgi:ATP-binding protein involved in chromosome partitioning
VLPPSVQNVLKDFSWQDRVFALNKNSDGKICVRFHSDGLNLEAKTQIEKIICDDLEQTTGVHNKPTISFERKVKPTAETKPPHASSQATTASAHAKPSAATRPIEGVKRIIAVASGKGGVGKSTVSVNLALALYNQGYRVGILDADIYGPSVPMMLRVHENPLINANNKMIPPEAYGLKVMSFGFFAPAETAVIWRGPMIMKALQQFFWDVEWGSLDFLIIDLPPGTGDAQLTLVQSLPLTGAVVVTTPQNIALQDAIKGISMFRKTKVPLLGVVENMSSFHCPACQQESFIFGSGGAHRVSEQFQVPLLGSLPLTTELCAASDTGEPLTVRAQHPLRIRFAEIAERIVKQAVSF